MIIPKTRQTSIAMKIKIFWFSAIFLLLSLTAPVRMVAQWPDWPVPEGEAAVLNPVERTPGALNNGRVLYETQCAACHGQRGLGDGAIAAPAMTTEAFAAQSDGALFWKLQQGRGQMPSFAQLPAEQLWEVIHYIRTFARPLETITRKKARLRLELVSTEESRKSGGHRMGAYR
jgi:mono/diheme cytochrome c family protein